MAELPPYRQLPDEPEPFDYTDPSSDTKRKAVASLREDRLREIDAAILSTPQGREWLWAILDSLHVNELRIAVTGSGYENGIWVGEYAVGNRLMRRFAGASPANFALMFHENDHV